MKSCVVCEDLAAMVLEAIKQMSEQEKAQVRVELRKSAGLPPQSEPDLYVN